MLYHLLLFTVECFACDFGKYCMTPGLNQSEGPCSAGYYCLSGASTPTPTDGTTGNMCPQGKYCLEGSFTDGTFSSLLVVQLIEENKTEKYECQETYRYRAHTIDSVLKAWDTIKAWYTIYCDECCV
jgi:hypothetical protein